MTNKLSAKVVVVGSTNWDICMYLQRLPGAGETIGDGRLKTAIGGKGANQAVASHLAGAACCFISCVGDDAAGQTIRGALDELALPTQTLVEVADTATGTACIFIDDAGENCIGITPGANAELTPALVAAHGSDIQEAAVMLVQLEVPMASVVAAAEVAQASGTRVILNPAPAQVLPQALLAQVDVLTPNRGELAVLSGENTDTEEGLERGLNKLLNAGVGMVIVTLGREGALLAYRQEDAVLCVERYAAIPVKAVDTTAAGDVFNGYLAAALAEVETSELAVEALSRAIRQAMLAAAISVTREGAMPSIPHRQELDEHTT